MCQRSAIGLRVVDGDTLPTQLVYLLPGLGAQLSVGRQYHHAVADAVGQGDASVLGGHAVQQGIGGEGIEVVALRQVGQQV